MSLTGITYPPPVNHAVLEALLCAHLVAAAPKGFNPAFCDADAGSVAGDLVCSEDSRPKHLSRDRYDDRTGAFMNGVDFAVELVAMVLSNPVGDTTEAVKAAVDATRKAVCINYDAKPGQEEAA